MPQSNATFANFICRFGDDSVLADYLVEIVSPAFTRDTYVRKFGRTQFFFYEVEIITLDEVAEPPVKALAGKFVKNTELVRHQVYTQAGLVQDEQHMQSSPSAFFVLILNNHRLIYFPETPHAPSLSEFKTTAEHFLRLRHKEFIEELYALVNSENLKATTSEKLPRITKKLLKEIHKRPTVEVAPLTGAQSVTAFIKRYDILKNINFRLIKPNPDIDAGEIFAQFREMTQELNGSRASVTVSNSKDGLDISAAIETVIEATAGGNQDISLNGIDQSGNKLQGSNEHFQISVPIDDVPSSRESLISKLYAAFVSLINAGDITLSPPSAEEVEKIRRQIEKI